MTVRWQPLDGDPHLPIAYREVWGPRTLPGVVVLDPEDAALLHEAVPEVLDALLALPEELMGGDVRRYATALGLRGARRDFLVAVGDMPRERYGRADLYATDDGWKLLEFNVASDLGGLDRSIASTAAGELCTALRPEAIDTLSLVAEALRRRSAAIGRTMSSIAIVVGSDCSPSIERMLHSLRAGLVEASGVRVEVLPLTALSVIGGQVSGIDGPIDVVLRYFTVEHALSPVDGEIVRTLVQGAREGRHVLWSSPNSSLFSNKAALSVLSRALDSGRSTLRDAARHLLVPSHPVAGAPSGPDGFGDGDWILKEATAAAGGGTVCSWEVDAPTWAAALADADGSAVVQRRVTPRAVDVCGIAYNVVIGMFVVDGVPAGFDARCAPAGSGDVVGWASNERTRVAPVIVRGGS